MNGESFCVTRISPVREALDYKDWAGIGGLDPYGQHQLLRRFFDLPRTPSTPQTPFLFRAELRDGLPLFYVLSRAKPHDISGKWRVESKGFRPALAKGDRLSFKLRANPIVSRATERGRRGQRHDVVMDAKQRMGWKDLPVDERPSLAHVAHEAGSSWLRGREGRMGCHFVTDCLRVDGHTVHCLKGYREDRRTCKGITLSTLDFEGVLEVGDVEVFINKALLPGIGPAKAFGCGLMLVRRV